MWHCEKGLMYTNGEMKRCMIKGWRGKEVKGKKEGWNQRKTGKIEVLLDKRV